MGRLAIGGGRNAHYDICRRQVCRFAITAVLLLEWFSGQLSGQRLGWSEHDNKHIIADDAWGLSIQMVPFYPCEGGLESQISETKRMINLQNPARDPCRFAAISSAIFAIVR